MIKINIQKFINIKEIEHNIIKIEENLINEGLIFHHSALERGYISRKEPPFITIYKGKFGHGYKLHIPDFRGSRYHIIKYFVFPRG